MPLGEVEVVAVVSDGVAATGRRRTAAGSLPMFFLGSQASKWNVFDAEEIFFGSMGAIFRRLLLLLVVDGVDVFVGGSCPLSEFLFVKWSIRKLPNLSKRILT